jgi:hypothetical protein
MWILLDTILTPSQRNWVVLLVALFAVSYLLFRPKLKKKKDPLEQPVFSSLAQQRTVERQMQNLLVELSEMARQISAQLDTRAAKLEALIQEADEKLAALRNATGGLSNAPNPTANFAMPASESRYVPSTTSMSAATMSPTTMATPSPKPAFPVDPRHAEVYALADSGRPVLEIADQLGKSSAEVNLILAMRPQD